MPTPLEVVECQTDNPAPAASPAKPWPTRRQRWFCVPIRGVPHPAEPSRPGRGPAQGE